MKNLRKIGIRTIGIVAILFVFNFIYSKFFFENDIKKHANIIEILPAPSASAQILYFAESSNFTTHKFDVDRRKISEMIAAYYPNQKLTTVNKGALHAGIYKVLLQQLPENNNIETVIITLNLRSFGADWIYSKLETSLQKSIVLLKPGLPLLNRIALSFKGYDVKTNKERLEQVIHHWRTDKLNFPYEFKYSNALDWEHALNKKGFWFENGQKNYDKTALSCHYVKSYAFDITENNIRIKDFDEIVDFCHKKGWNVVFNLMAENTEKAKELVGDDLIFLMNRNRNFLIDRYSKRGVIVVDNLDDVHNQYYIDQNWTTEHYTEEGRHAIAQNVADSLQRIYPNKQENIEIPTAEQKSYFTNDCEEKSDWTNTNSYSTEKAFDGKQSSKTFSEMPYSVTFERPLKFIPDSTKNKVHLTFQVWQTDVNSETKAVVELQGDYIKPQWIAQPIKNTTENTWQKQSLTFDLGKVDLTAYNFIKVYCSNKSTAPSYIDNWEVIFE